MYLCIKPDNTKTCHPHYKNKKNIYLPLNVKRNYVYMIHEFGMAKSPRIKICFYLLHRFIKLYSFSNNLKMSAFKIQGQC